MILQSLKAGLSQTRENKRLILIYYLANLLFSVILLLPFRTIVKDFIGGGVMGETLAGRFNLDFWAELFRKQHNLGEAVTSLIMFIPVAYWVLLLFLSGGVLAVLLSGEKYSAARFWGNCGKFFGRFVRLGLWSLPVFAILFSVQYLETGLQRLIYGKQPYQYISYWGGWIRMLISYLGIIYYAVILDYARIIAVKEDMKKMRVALWRAVKFSLRHFLNTFGLGLAVFFAGALILLIYNPLANVLAAPNAIVVLLLFLMQQAYMVTRMLLKVTLFAGQIHMYHGLMGAAAPAVAPESPEAGLAGAGAA